MRAKGSGSNTEAFTRSCWISLVQRFLRVSLDPSEQFVDTSGMLDLRLIGYPLQRTSERNTVDTNVCARYATTPNKLSLRRILQITQKLAPVSSKRPRDVIPFQAQVKCMVLIAHNTLG